MDDGDWIELDGGILRTEYEGACGEAFVGAQRLIPARSPNLEGFVPNWNTALPPYNIVKGLLLETETCTRGIIQCRCEGHICDVIFHDSFVSSFVHQFDICSLVSQIKLLP